MNDPAALTTHQLTSLGTPLRLTAGGTGRAVLVLHGGPGMSANYLDSLADELTGYRIAWYQQRGLPPSVEDGPYDVPAAGS